MKVRFVDLPAQDAPLRNELEEAVLEVLRRADYVLGDEVVAFESAFASYCGSAHAIGVGSGLAAIELILRGYGVGAGDEVVVPAHTFVGTAGAVTLAGATPVLVDVRDDFTIDPDQVELALTARTKAIIAVHLYGRPAAMDALVDIAREHGVKLIEDAAQAHGAEHRGRRTGTLGDAAAFSFYPSKNLGASGDAGIVTTDDDALAARVRALRNCGQFEKNVHALVPCNHRLDTIQAAALRVRLRALDAWNEGRRRAAEWYFEALEGSGLLLPPRDGPLLRSVWHLYVVRTSGRERLAAHLARHGVPTAVHYPLPVHLQPIYRQLGLGPGSFPRAEAMAEEVLSLPMHPTLRSEEVARVAEVLQLYARAEAA